MSETEIVQPSKRDLHPYMTIVLCLLTAGVVWYWESKNREHDLAAFRATATTQMEAFGQAMQARGNVVTTAELEKKLRDGLGRELAAQIARTDGTVQALIAAIGTIKGGTQEGPKVALPAPLSAAVDLTLAQERPGPPLTAVRLVGAPGSSQLTQTWQNNSELFRVNVAEWRTAEDGARAALTLERDVLRADGSKIGTEKIPVTDANAYFSADMISRAAPVPAYSVFLGSSVDTRTGGRRAAFFVQRHLDKKWAVTTGIINSGAFLGASYTFGRKP